MAINPIQSLSSMLDPSAQSTVTTRNRANSGFEALLGSLGSAAPGNRSAAAPSAAAELLRIQMMQTFLSLSGEAEGQAPEALPALEALLAGSARTCRLPASVASSPIPGLEAPAAEMSAADPALAVETTAESYLGTPYRFGGEGADGIDCSSFVQKVFRKNQIELPRTAREQSKVGTDVAPGDLRKGDLLFFHTYASYPSHVGIYLGNGKMIHASSGHGEVAISEVNSDFYRNRFMGAKRVITAG